MSRGWIIFFFLILLFAVVILGLVAYAQRRDYFYIYSRTAGTYLSVDNTTTTPTVILTSTPDNNGIWIFSPIDAVNPIYTILNPNTGLYLSYPATITEGTPVTLLPDQALAGRWTIIGTAIFIFNTTYPPGFSAKVSGSGLVLSSSVTDGSNEFLLT